LNSPFALAASITCSMRLRMRLAVSVLPAQIGSRIRTTGVVSIAPMGISRKVLQ